MTQRVAHESPMKRHRDTIRIFCVDDMRYTPFEPDAAKLAELLGCRIKFTRCSFLADLIVSRNISEIRSYVGWRPGRFMVWTHEPRHDIVGQSVVRQGKKDIHIMNVYTGDVFLDNYYYLRPTLRNVPDPVTGFPPDKARLCCIVAGYGIREPKLPPPAFDLTRTRCEWGLHGHTTGRCDVFGGHWPEGVSIKENRGGEWYFTKRDLLRPYKFNLGMENTSAAHYVTEKIWDPIECQCLPIYHGGPPSTIYDDFPPDSFVDLSNFSFPDELFTYLEQMSEAEWTERMNKCISVLRTAYDRSLPDGNVQEKALHALADRIRTILDLR